MLEKLFKLFRENDEELYLVGGYVRDRLLGREAGDCDFATSARPEKTMEILVSGGLKAIPIGIAFGTVATLDPEDSREAQITTYRCSESYKKGSRHPDVAFGKNLEEDLKRRDFTVNSMAMDDKGEVIDPLGGRADLEKGIIRTPLNPEVTFREDPLRMLRAFRFACRLGFSIDAEAFEAIGKHHTAILDISRERWKQEMDSLLTAEKGKEVSRVLKLMKETGILEDLIPAFKMMFRQHGLPQGKAHFGDIWEHTLDTVSNLKDCGTCERWAALLHDIGKPAARTEDEDGRIHFYGHEKYGAEYAEEIAVNFRFSKKEKKCVSFLVKNHMRPVLYSDEWSDRAVRKLAWESGEYFEKLLDLASADIAAHSEPYAAEGAEKISALRQRLLTLVPQLHRRVLPRDLGIMLKKKASTGTPAEIGIILENLEELVLQGILPEMAAPRIYIEYISEHPELKQRQNI